MTSNLVIYTTKGDSLTVEEMVKSRLELALPDLLDAKTYHTLLALKNKEYLMGPAEKDAAFYGLLDCVLGLLYDLRITDFEGNCESHWTITKLSATLSAFVKHNSPRAVLTSFCRRSLVFPLYRCFELSLKVIEDLCMCLFVGKKLLLKLLLQIRAVFNANNPKYLLNNIFIDDYCVFVQQLDDQYIKDKLAEVMKVRLSFEDLGFPDVEDDETGELEDLQ